MFTGEMLDKALRFAQEVFAAQAMPFSAAPRDYAVYTHPQSWSDTTMGAGGVGGQVISTGQTIVVVDELNGCAVVMHDGARNSYFLPSLSEQFWLDLANHRLRGKLQAVSCYVREGVPHASE